jgi:hypothetical protein
LKRYHDILYNYRPNISDILVKVKNNKNQDKQQFMCCICQDDHDGYVNDKNNHLGGAEHFMCESCFIKSNTLKCPMCRAELKFSDEITDYITQQSKILKSVDFNTERLSLISEQYGI